MGRRAVAGPVVLRGQVWLADVGLDEAKRFVIVSNNERNRRLQDVLGVRLTTALKPELPSVVPFKADELGPPRSFAVADDILPILKGDLVRPVGAFNLEQMRRLDSALRAALALRN